MADLGYPFAVVVGQEQVKKALLYNLIEPRIGGVLLCGEKGTAKSTIVRGMAALTDQKVVDLPLSITEDMLVGAIDFERAVKEGVKAFSPGLLQRAHENILYVDEVNLLPDGIVSTLICAAAKGENLVEREGISYRHESRFVLVGTMNPEEGKLRPQFLDRFGLYVDVAGEPDLEKRVEIIRRRMDYERDPAAFCGSWAEQSDLLRRRISRAKRLVKQVEPDASIRSLAGKYVQRAQTEGNRCEVVLLYTAAAAAAWNGRDYITAEDLKEAAFFVLPHRRRRETPPAEDRMNEKSTQEPDPSDTQSDGQGRQAPREQLSDREQTYERRDGNDGEEVETPPLQSDESGGAEEERLTEGEEVSLLSILPALPRDRIVRKGSGRRSKTKCGTNKGRYVSFISSSTPRQHDLALDATLRVAASYQRGRDHSECVMALTDDDLRFKVRENHAGATIVFAVDASSSMGAQKRMKTAKEAILSMLLDSYQKRDRIGLVAFRKNGAETGRNLILSVQTNGTLLTTEACRRLKKFAAVLASAWTVCGKPIPCGCFRTGQRAMMLSFRGSAIWAAPVCAAA